ncbi:hypothetical protein C8N32_10522 [Rhodovulum imhoffii]|uniref:Uncharacterized protein n=1 Tax=Rhodovulum imhoffii TaxID=365340 RepID=A0A2T5BT91_9RHOB|nr:DUF6477 family protein [Rhodovulum imhoffii]MBK5932983.1 hypothetical protein [Rhodovulum imhoffii]PTN02652.1 hypothetical protein C8N32_10522 [Rhodovulum imhoffii]
MDDLLKSLREMRRPRLLIRAARCGLSDYRRERDLPRIPGLAGGTPARQLAELMARETQINDARSTGGATYNAAHHVEVMIALMAEARELLARPCQPVQAETSSSALRRVA